jgi:hypothetical protein
MLAYVVPRSADKTGQLAEPEQRARRRYLNLRKLGTSAKNAGGFARTSKGYWRVALHLGRKTGMTNEWLENEGLIEIKQEWWNVKFLRITALKQTA